MSDKEIHIHVGENFDAMAKRVADAWHRAEKQEAVCERHISFVGWDMLASVMTNRRYELLRYVKHHPVESVAALARAIHRDYKRVHEDVSALENIGLLQRQNGKLFAGYDRIESSISL